MKYAVVLFTIFCCFSCNKKDDNTAPSSHTFITGNWNIAIQIKEGNGWVPGNPDTISFTEASRYVFNSDYTCHYTVATFAPGTGPANPVINRWLPVKPGTPIGNPSQPVPGTIIEQKIAGYWLYDEQAKVLIINDQQRQPVFTWHVESISATRITGREQTLTGLPIIVPGTVPQRIARIIFVKK